MISFLFPSLLAGLAAIAVPILIHFFYRRQLKVVPISTLRFLKIADETLPRQPRWQHLLLLLLRCLLVALLVFFLAKPYFATDSGTSDAAQPLHRVVLVDRSLSMTLRAGETSAFSLAKKHAVDLIGGLRYQDTLTLLLFDQNPVPLTGSHRSDHERAQNAVREAKTRIAVTSPRHALQAALRYCDDASSRSARNEVIALTDLRSSDVADWIEARQQLRDARNLSRVVLLNCGVESKPNFAITSARLVQPTSSATANNALALQVTSSIAQPFEKKIEITVNDQPPSVVTVRSQQGEPATLEVPLSSAVGGLWRGSARLMEDDSLADDNQRVFCFKPSRSDRIFLVDGAPSAVRSLSETYYLGVALATLPDERAFDVAVGTLEKLPWDALDRLGTILVANVPKLSAEQAGKLHGFVRGGGNLILALGDQVDADAYNQVLRSAGNALLPCTLGPVLGEPGKRIETFFLGEIDPGFDGFDLGENADTDAFRHVRFFAFHELIKPDPESHVIARFNTGQPALLSKDIGDGHVYVFASSVAAVWNDFPLRATYLPFWRNFLSYLAHLGAPPRQFIVGETARVLRSTRDSAQEKLFVLSPDKQKLDPMITSDSILLPNTPRPGLYRIVNEAGTELDPGFAVNLPARESQTAPATAEDVTRLKAAGFQIVSASDAAAVAKLARPAENNAFPMAAWIALVAVIAAAGEWVYSNQLSKETEE